WSASPEEAFETTLALNNRWFLDGRDANSFTNVGWIFGLHDRPWGPQPVFGTVRSMGANTFKKFDAEAYVRSFSRDLSARAAAGDGPGVLGRLTSDGGRAFMLLDAAIGDLA
ncbi:MAG: hypothetical protein QME55_09305, partial [Brevundimonas sp.]|nr:hypothetical protein [Brevundimonas sp.]